ncbi:non-histone chromosomal MC1 family protein [Methanohalophilus sp.]
MSKSEPRNFVLRDEKGNEHGVFTGKQPRQAALKVANRGKGTKNNPDKIMLRERGTKKVHIFYGWKQEVDAPKNKPDWMPDKINKPFVKKEKPGIIKLEQV